MKQSLQSSFSRKLKSVYHKKWSAPTMVSIFIIICMLFIYTCETIGLTSKEKMISFRFQSPEMNVKNIGEIMIPSNEKAIITETISPEVLLTKLEENHLESREMHIKLMQQILVEATRSQMEYLNQLNNTSMKIKESNTVYQYYDI